MLNIRITEAIYYLASFVLIFPPPGVLNSFTIGSLFFTLRYFQAAVVAAWFALLFCMTLKVLIVHYRRVFTILASFWAFCLVIIIDDIMSNELPTGPGLLLLQIGLFAVILVRVDYMGRLHGFLRILYFYCYALLICNLFSTIVYPGGLSKGDEWQPIYFLLNANSFAFEYLFIFVVGACYMQRKGKRRAVSVIILLLIELITYLILEPKSSLTGELLVLLSFAIYCFGGKLSWLGNGIKYLISIGIVQLLLLMLAYLREFIVSFFSFFNISATSFLARIEIWNYAVQRVLSSPPAGVGSSIIQFSLGDGGRPRSAHNMYLQISHYSGLLGLTLWLYPIIAVLAPRILDDVKNYMERRFLRFSLVAYLILFVVEQNVFSAEFYCLVLFAACVDRSVQPKSLIGGTSEASL